MGKKIVDFLSYKFEKALKSNGFTIKKDDNKQIKVVMKLNDKDMKLGE